MLPLYYWDTARTGEFSSPCFGATLMEF